MNYACFATYIETDHSSHLMAKCNVFHGTIHCSVKFPFYAISDGTNTAALMYLYFAFHLTNINLVHSLEHSLSGNLCFVIIIANNNACCYNSII